MNMKVITENSITLFDGLEPIVIHRDHPEFSSIKSYLSWEDDEGYQIALEIANPRKSVIKNIKDTNFELVGDCIYYDSYRLPDELATRIIDLISENHSVFALENFVINLLENPSFRAVQELYDFLQVAKLPITEDGHFIAYKSVTIGYKDHFTRMMDNSVGAQPTMPRNVVDEDKHRTCSNGLHFAAYEYAAMFGGSDSRLMAVKINPRDVVAIPADYNNQKGRACTYEIVEEIESGEDELADCPLYLESDSDDQYQLNL